MSQVPDAAAPRAKDFSRVAITVAAGVVGVLLFITGAVLAIWSYAANGFDVKDWMFWAGYGGMIVSFFLFAWLLQWNKDLERLSPAIRRTLYGYNVFLAMVFLGATLILVNILVTQYGRMVGIKPTYDWTSQGVFTLSPVTVQQLDALPKPVKVYALYQRDTRTGAQIDQLLQMYAHASKNFVYEFVDRFQDRARAEELLKKYPAAATREQALIVTYGSGDSPPHKVIKDSDIFKVSLRELDMMSGQGGGDTSFNGENALTSAVRSLVEGKQTNAYFTEGHGELDLSNSDSRGESALRGLGLVKERLTDLNIKAEPLDLVKSEVPSDASVLVIAGPRSAFQPAEVQKIRDFMDRRDSENNRTGRLLVLMDSPPEMRGTSDAGLGDLLAGYKVRIRDNVVYDVRSAYQTADNILVRVGSETPHPIVAPLKGERVLMSEAREVDPISDTPPPGAPPTQPPDKMQATKLFSTSENPYSWGEGDYASSRRPAPGGDNDTPGPVSVAVAVSEGEAPPPNPHPFGPPPAAPKTTPVAVVFGDATFASNSLVSQLPQNQDLFLNALNWLGGRIADIGIQPRVKKYARLDVDNGGYYTMIFEPMFHMVAIAGFVAGLVWVIRSDRYDLLWLPIAGTIVLLLAYAGLCLLFIGSLKAEATRATLFRLFVTCILLWLIGLAAWLYSARPARATPTA